MKSLIVGVVLSLLLGMTVTPARAVEPDPGDEHFSTYCADGEGATEHEQRCFDFCEPVEEEVDEFVETASAARLVPGFLAPLIRLLIPKVQPLDYRVMDRPTGEVEIETNGYRAADQLIAIVYQLPWLENSFFRSLLRAFSDVTTFLANFEHTNRTERRFQICLDVLVGDTNVNHIDRFVDEYMVHNEWFTRDRTDLTVDTTPGAVVASAESRLVAYENVDAATEVWLKGKQYTYAKMVKNDPDFVANYPDPSLGVFRLRPTEYHQFHAPLGGELTRIHRVGGSLWSVQPIAMHNPHIDVFGENKRVILEFESPEVGRYLMIPVGAAAVGKIVLEVVEGDTVAKGDRIGRFEYGGSSVVVVFPNGTATWNQDIVDASADAIEARVDVGEQVAVVTE